MAKPKKTKWGTWTTRVLDYREADGTPHYKRITKPTKAECELAAMLFKTDEKRKRPRHAMTVGDACDKYIDLCSVLSPVTVDGYRKDRRNGFPHLMDVPVDDLTEILVQDAINTEACRMGRRGPISAKTLANEWGLISASLWRICRLRFDVTLPKRQKHIKEYPEPAEVIAAVRGTSIELPCMLALWLSFTVSEIRGLMWSDLSGDTITINRVIVDVGTVPTIKQNAKTEARLRRHRVPPYILELLEKADHSSEFIVPLNHNQLYGRFRNIMDAAGLGITFHDLRHLSASVMLQLGVPEKYAMERGGWASPNVMRSVYQHTFSSQRRAVDDLVDGYFAQFVCPTDTSVNSSVNFTPKN